MKLVTEIQTNRSPIMVHGFTASTFDPHLADRVKELALDAEVNRSVNDTQPNEFRFEIIHPNGFIALKALAELTANGFEAGDTWYAPRLFSPVD